MRFVPALDRGNIDALAEERADFSYSGLSSRRGFLVTESGDLGVIGEVPGLWSVPEGVAQELVEPWLMGRSADGIVHGAWSVTDEEAAGYAQQYGIRFEPITAIGADLSDDEALLGAQAVALSRWHRTDRFCGGCGQPVAIIQGGWETRCTGCGRIEYPRQDPAVIVLITDAADRVLLAHNVAFRETMMSLPAGFIEAGETPRRAVEREVAEEIGIAVGQVEYLGAQPWPGPRSLMLGFSARTVEDAPVVAPDGEEIDHARFFTRAEYEAALLDGTVSAPRSTAIANVLLSQWLGKTLPYPQP